jgi:hypothetical protein
MLCFVDTTGDPKVVIVINSLDWPRGLLLVFSWFHYTSNRLCLSVTRSDVGTVNENE